VCANADAQQEEEEEGEILLNLTPKARFCATGRTTQIRFLQKQAPFLCCAAAAGWQRPMATFTPSPRSGITDAFSAFETSLEQEAARVVRSTDAQLASLRDAALSLSVERRRDRRVAAQAACCARGVARTVAHVPPKPRRLRWVLGWRQPCRGRGRAACLRRGGRRWVHAAAAREKCGLLCLVR
jgi:hypothetical protein